jgi:hypothetical protein
MENIAEQHHPPLSSSEIANLWGSYMNDSMSVCVIKYFLHIVQDVEVKSVLEYALSLSEKHINQVIEFFQAEQIPIPIGFSEADVNIAAPRLFSDYFLLTYITQMSAIGLNSYSVALANSARMDVRIMYTHCLETSAELFNRGVNLQEAMGLLVRAPYIPIPEQVDMVDMVDKQNFLTGWLGDRRPLAVTEISFIFFNMTRNVLGNSLLTGFSQVAASREIREYMRRGAAISSKHIEVFGSILTESALPSPMTWDSQPTRSQISPFSDKLMMFHAAMLAGAGVGFYGTSLSVNPRHDLGAHYTQLMAEVGQYANDGANIMINNQWLEQPPLAADRKALSRT